MTALFIIGIVTGLLGWLFFWLNLNTPVQTCLPVILWPVSVVCLLLFLGMRIASVDTRPKGEDAKQASFTSGAVAKPDAGKDIA